MKTESIKNEAIALMHESLSFGLKLIADHIVTNGLDSHEVVELLREIIDEQEAQSVVVRLRDKI